MYGNQRRELSELQIFLFYFFLQTTHEDYKFSDYEVYRSEGDFEWLQSALEEACPERIVPPMVSHSSLHGK